MKEIVVLNIPINNTTSIDLLNDIGKYKFLIPVNVDVLLKLNKDAVFRELIIKNRDHIRIVNDSQIINFTARMVLNKKFKEKISGSDFLPFLCGVSAKTNNYRIFLLGGLDDSATLAQNNINSRFNANIIVGSYSPSFGFESNVSENLKILELINSSGANVLAVGVGAPKQEKWIFKHSDLLPSINLFMAVGATIDFEAGKVKRAPKWMSATGLEWLYRLIKEPRRLYKRYLFDAFPFFSLLLKQRFNRRDK